MWSRHDLQFLFFFNLWCCRTCMVVSCCCMEACFLVIAIHMLVQFLSSLELNTRIFMWTDNSNWAVVVLPELMQLDLALIPLFQACCCRSTTAVALRYLSFVWMVKQLERGFLPYWPATDQIYTLQDKQSGYQGLWYSWNCPMPEDFIT